MPQSLAGVRSPPRGLPFVIGPAQDLANAERLRYWNRVLGIAKYVYRATLERPGLGLVGPDWVL
eukprot:6767920-Prymnesium_polylepis.1